MAVRNLKDQHQSQFVKLFEQLIGRYSRWQSFGNLSDAVDWVKRKEQKLYEMYKGRLRL